MENKNQKWTKIINNSVYGAFGSDIVWYTIYNRYQRSKLRKKKIKNILGI